MTELPDECDYCDSVLEEDEELAPVYIGSPPTPGPMTITGEAAECRQVAGWSNSANGDVHHLERPIDESQAIIDAIESCRLIDAEVKPIVEVEDGRNLHVYEGEQGMNEYRNDYRNFERNNTGKVKATLKIEPDFTVPSPDMMVCEYCKESFRGENESSSTGLSR